MKSTVIEHTVQNHLCVSCGICAAVCPQQCIGFSRKNGQYLPKIDSAKCTDCGICAEICSSYSDEYSGHFTICKQTPADDIFAGNHLTCYRASARDERIRYNSTSGGAITAIVNTLLSSGTYQCAFLVDDFNYSVFIGTKRYSRDNPLDHTSKSRYIPISHKAMVEYVLDHPNDMVIIVAVGCAIHTFLNVINKFNLNRDQYLLLGLFCDRTLSYNIFDYFNDFDKKRDLDNLYFRTKEQSGWPGNVKLEYTNKESVFLPASERMMVKSFFQLERCLYCIDKLNIFSDISFGDDYSTQEKDRKGNSSIICRTKLGEDVLDKTKEHLNLSMISIQDIKESQQLSKRSENLEFARALFLRHGINLYPGILDHDSTLGNTAAKELQNRKNKISIGQSYPKSKKKINSFVKKRRK